MKEDYDLFIQLPLTEVLHHNVEDIAGDKQTTGNNEYEKDGHLDGISCLIPFRIIAEYLVSVPMKSIALELAMV